MDGAKLIAQIDALLSLDARGALVPHGIGGLARGLLTECRDTVLSLSEVQDAIESAVACLRHTHDRLIDYPQFETLRLTLNAEVRNLRAALSSESQAAVSTLFRDGMETKGEGT